MMEMCSYGTLYEVIKRNGMLREARAAAIFRTLVRIIWDFLWQCLGASLICDHRGFVAGGLVVMPGAFPAMPMKGWTVTFPLRPFPPPSPLSASCHRTHPRLWRASPRSEAGGGWRAFFSRWPLHPVDRRISFPNLGEAGSIFSDLKVLTCLPLHIAIG